VLVLGERRRGEQVSGELPPPGLRQHQGTGGHGAGQDEHGRRDQPGQGPRDRRQGADTAAPFDLAHEAVHEEEPAQGQEDVDAAGDPAGPDVIAHDQGDGQGA
jgi:hypothetical protein